MIPRIAVSEASGAGELLVLGPSLGTSSILWDSTAAILRQHYRVVTWDLPGHGTSPAAREPFTVGEIALGLLDALGDERFRYAGVSLGGATGLELLLHAQERVDAAAVICSGAKIGTTEGWVERAITTRTLGTASLVGPSAGRWFAPGSIERHPDATGRLLHSLRDADDESYALCAEALATYDVRALLGNIEVPVLALWGEHDAVVGERESAEIAAGVRRGSSGKVAGAAHLPPVEQPEAVASRLTEFFEGVG
ncbi:MAG: Alpha/beta hydrolase [Rhodoglobus sp.]|jgi:3-oxoadipate enol-lactonase|nr:Alpha/beta hydrolase [Rhodoglobus sp.]